MGLKPADYYDWCLTFADFWLMWDGFEWRNELEIRQTRFIGAMIHNTQMGIKRADMVREEKLWPLPSDKEISEVKREISKPEDFKKAREKYQKILDAKNSKPNG